MSFSSTNLHDPAMGSGATTSSSSSSSATSSRRPSTLKLNCDSAVSSTSSEWTARTEDLTSPADPFGDQSALVDDNVPIVKRTIIRKVGLKRNSVAVPLDSKQNDLNLDELCARMMG
ncbi:hypothetical protein TYRP_004430 [Tyrophagus putrescentiae]|nr:hypothetical protein TYRP_004430 [Tyrophagus putrescentiae]